MENQIFKNILSWEIKAEMLFSKVGMKMRKAPMIIYWAAHNPSKEDGFVLFKVYFAA